MDKPIKKCPKCYSDSFKVSFTTFTTAKLDKDGVLTVVDEDTPSMDGIIECDDCGKEFTASDFLDIICK